MGPTELCRLGLIYNNKLNIIFKLYTLIKKNYLKKSHLMVTIEISLFRRRRARVIIRYITNLLTSSRINTRMSKSKISEHETKKFKNMYYFLARLIIIITKSIKLLTLNLNDYIGNC